MGRLLPGLCLLAAATVTSLPNAAAQKVKKKAKTVSVDYLRQPTLPLPTDVRTYSASVSASTYRRTQIGEFVGELESALAIPGYARAPLGDIHLELIPTDVDAGRVRLETRSEKTKAEEGSVVVETYAPVSNVYFGVDLRIIRRGGEVLYEEHFGPVRGGLTAGEGQVVSPGVAGYNGTPIEHESTRAPIVVTFGSPISDHKLASRKLRNRSMDAMLAKARQQAVSEVLSPLRYRLAQMGFVPQTASAKVWTMKEGHPETEAFNAATAELIVALLDLGPGADLEAARSAAAEPVAYFTRTSELPAASDEKAEKQVGKLRELALDNLVHAKAFLERNDELERLFATLSEREVVGYQQTAFSLSGAAVSRLAASPLDSRYADDYAEASSLDGAPAVTDPEALYGLLTAQLEAESIDEQIGLRDGEVEVAAVAYGEDVASYAFTGLLTPRVVRADQDGKTGLARLSAAGSASDPQIILGDNVRGYRLQDGVVTHFEFVDTPYDSIVFGERTFLKPFEKRMPDGGTLLTTLDAISPRPLWYERAYSSPAVRVYQHAWTPLELDAYELDESSASYALAIDGEKVVHTSGDIWLLNPVKRISKRFDCPAVDAFVEGEKPGMHFYALIEMAERYDADCAQ